jgi:hypothetical protein
VSIIRSFSAAHAVSGPVWCLVRCVLQSCCVVKKILREFPDKFREYYRMNVKTFDYILNSVKFDLQGYSNFRKCTETEEKLNVALPYVLVTVVRIKFHYIVTMVNAIEIQCNLKGSYTRKSKNYTKLQ